jgi:hypothetical protein
MLSGRGAAIATLNLDHVVKLEVTWHSAKLTWRTT